MNTKETEILQLIDEHGDSGDAWGSCMGALFQLAALLSTDDGVGVPDSWDYRHGGGPELDEDEDRLAIELRDTFGMSRETQREYVAIGEHYQEVRDRLIADGKDY